MLVLERLKRQETGGGEGARGHLKEVTNKTRFMILNVGLMDSSHARTLTHTHMHAHTHKGWENYPRQAAGSCSLIQLAGGEEQKDEGHARHSKSKTERLPWESSKFRKLPGSLFHHHHRRHGPEFLGGAPTSPCWAPCAHVGLRSKARP